MAKTGPRVEFVRDDKNVPIVGLRLQKSTDRKNNPFERYFSLDGKGGRVYHGNSRDKAGAIFRFRQWEAQQKRDEIALPMGTAREVGPVNWVTKKISKEAGVTLIQESAFYAKAGDMIHKDPVGFAQKANVPEVANLKHLKPPLPSAKLADIGDLYLTEKKAAIHPQELRASKQFWGEFERITRATLVSDLDRDSFRHYREQIRRNQGKKSNAYTRARFGKIKSIIRYALCEMDLSPEDRNTLGLSMMLKKPPKPAPHPIDLTPFELHAILDLADDLEKALILTALNCAYNPVDLGRLRWEMIDFNNKTIHFDRQKSAKLAKGGCLPRVAVLWDRTIKALEKVKNPSPNVFITRYGQAISENTVTNRWRSLVKKSGLPARKVDGKSKSLAFAHLRSSAQTAAAASTDPVVPVQQYQILAGHAAAGVDDNYVRRHPRIVELACRAIENTYFGEAAMKSVAEQRQKPVEENSQKDVQPEPANRTRRSRHK